MALKFAHHTESCSAAAHFFFFAGGKVNFITEALTNLKKIL